MRKTQIVGALLWRGGLLLAAVINVRFVTSQVMAGAAELLAYGTAVKLEKEA